MRHARERGTTGRRCHGRRGAVLVSVLLTGTALLALTSSTLLLAGLQVGAAAWQERRLAARAAALAAPLFLQAWARTSDADTWPDSPPISAASLRSTLTGGVEAEIIWVGYRPFGAGALEVEAHAEVTGAAFTAGARLPPLRSPRYRCAREPSSPTLRRAAGRRPAGPQRRPGQGSGRLRSGRRRIGARFASVAGP